MTAIRSPALTARVLERVDDAALRRLVDADPYVNVVVAGRLSHPHPLDSGERGGQLVGIENAEGELIGACLQGATILPLGGTPDSWRRLGYHLGQRGRTCSSLVGRIETVEVLWPVLVQYWGPARLIRPAQPMLVLDRPPTRVDPLVRPVRMNELDRYLPAAEAMFAEELGLAPFTGAAKRSYRARLGELVAAERVLLRLDRQGRVAFKAEIGAVSPATAQVQGVWVRPDLRGRGLGTAAVAAVLQHALRLAPTASLYVNDFNVAARRLYDRLGMQQVATLSTVMF